MIAFVAGFIVGAAAALILTWWAMGKVHEGAESFWRQDWNG